MGKRITIIIFLLFIYGFFAWSSLKGDESYSELENRRLAEYPEFSAESFFDGKFTAAYEKYIQDQFPMRGEFVALKNNIELACGKDTLKGILLGRDGWLIENHKKEEYESERAQKNASAIIAAGNRWEKRLGAEHTSVMVVPTAQTILRDRLPSFAEPYNQMEYINKIKNGLTEGVFVDAAQTLEKHSGEYIYYRTDHHWTTYGAYLAYRQWCEDKKMTPYELDELDIKEAADDFRGTIHSKLNIKTAPDTIEIYSVKDYNVKAVYNMGAETRDSLYDMSYLKGKDKYSLFFGGNQGLVEIVEAGSETVSDKRPETASGSGAENADKEHKESVLLVVKDSYANCFVPMTMGMFDRVYVVDLRYFNMRIDSFMDMYGVTDVLLLYNAATLTDDVYVSRLG